MCIYAESYMNISFLFFRSKSWQHGTETDLVLGVECKCGWNKCDEPKAKKKLFAKYLTISCEVSIRRKKNQVVNKKKSEKKHKNKETQNDKIYVFCFLSRFKIPKTQRHINNVTLCNITNRLEGSLLCQTKNRFLWKLHHMHTIKMV